MNEIIISAVSAVLIGLITWLTKNLVAWIKTKIKNERIATAFAEVAESVGNSVKTVAQTYVYDLKKTGKFDKEAAQQALKNAASTAFATLSDRTVKVLSQEKILLQQWLENKIEAAVHDLKAGGK